MLAASKSRLIPYTTLFRSRGTISLSSPSSIARVAGTGSAVSRNSIAADHAIWRGKRAVVPPLAKIDRKSTRLKSSHVEISYAVFCLKKKKDSVTKGCQEKL